MLARAIAELLAPRHQIIAASHEEADVTDASAISRVIEVARPDIVVNPAGLTYVDACESQPELAMRVNGEGPGNIAAACKKLRIPMMHFSTDYVFNGEKPSPYTEEDEPGPLSVYGRSKLEGEHRVAQTLDKYWIVRVCGVFGPYRGNFVSLVVDLGRKGGPLRIVRDQRLAPTYTFDAAIAIEQILLRGGPGIYHVTNQGFTSRLDFTRGILREAGFPNVEVIPISAGETRRPAPRPKNSQLENARLKREGIPLLPPWPDAVRRYLAQLRALA